MPLVESFSGIRGIYNKELTEKVAVKYAYSFANLIKSRLKKAKGLKVVIGMDTRISGGSLKQALIEGLDSNIIDVGILPTPAIEHAVRYFKADCGIIITASHNEPEFNGFKFLDQDGAVLRPKEMQEVIDSFHKLKDLAEEEFLSLLYKDANKEEKMRIKHVDKREKEALFAYKRFLLNFFSKKELESIKNSNMKIVVDTNGGAGFIAKEFFEELKLNFEYINIKPGIFKRKIEPTEDSLEYLAKEIKKQKAGFAAGFDCDADRVEIILEDGTLVSGNHILALIADEVLSEIKNKKNQIVVVNDATSWLVKEIVEKNNVKYEEVEVGEINVVEKMLGYESIIGGEGSNGGVIITPSRCRDGILTLLYILKIMAKKKKSLKGLINELPKYYYLKEKIKLKKDFFSSREKIEKYYLDNGYSLQETGDKTGGLKAIKNGSWVWFRQSKTEDKVLRVIADSKDEKIAKKLIEEGRSVLKKYKIL